MMTTWNMRARPRICHPVAHIDKLGYEPFLAVTATDQNNWITAPVTTMTTTITTGHDWLWLFVVVWITEKA